MVPPPRPRPTRWVMPSPCRLIHRVAHAVSASDGEATNGR
jgi:hypothetical protein